MLQFNLFYILLIFFGNSFHDGDTVESLTIPEINNSMLVHDNNTEQTIDNGDKTIVNNVSISETNNTTGSHHQNLTIDSFKNTTADINNSEPQNTSNTDIHQAGLENRTDNSSFNSLQNANITNSTFILILPNGTEFRSIENTNRTESVNVGHRNKTFSTFSELANITSNLSIFNQTSFITINITYTQKTNSTYIEKLQQLSNTTVQLSPVQNGSSVIYNSTIKNNSSTNPPPSLLPSLANSGGGGSKSSSKPLIIHIGKTTLSEVCLHWNIPDKHCKCPNLGKQLCAMFKNDKAVKQVIVSCSSTHKAKTYSTIVICSVGIIGNLLCLLVTMVNEKNTICRKVIGMLAAVDLIFSCLSFAGVVPGLWSCKWEYNDHVCKFLYSMINSTAIMALGFILIISMERFNGIVKPFMNQSSDKKVAIMSAINISLAVLFVVPTIIVSKVQHKGDAKICVEDWPEKEYSLYYSWFMMIFTFIIPIVAISALYMGIVKSLRKSQNHTRKTFSLKEQSRRRKEDGRITIIISYLLISFAVLVSPNRIVWVLYDHGALKGISAEVLAYVRIASSVPYIIHACINPIIYSLVDKKFRGNLKYIFLRFSCQKKATVHVKNAHKGSFNNSDRGTSLSNASKSTIRKTSSTYPSPSLDSTTTKDTKLDRNN